jgi:uncharacterized membrane protein YdjX (TVP38/TMEM64 family)
MTNRKFLKPMLLIVFIIAAIVLVRMTGLVRFFNKAYIEQFIGSMGPMGPLLFIGLYFFAMLFFLPGTPLSLAAGFLFGGVKGTLYIVIGASLGAGGAFLLARFLGKEFVDRILKNKFKKINEYDQKLEKNGFLTVLFLRLVPLFPFNGLNFALGLTKVTFKDYLLATVVGIIPGSLLIANIGGSATNITDPKFFLFIALFILLAAVPTMYKKIQNRPKRKKSRRLWATMSNFWKGVLIVAGTSALFFGMNVNFEFSRITDVQYLQDTFQGFGMLAPIGFMLIMALAIIISPIPSLPLSAVSGVIWGPYIGTLYAVVGAEIGAILAFLIARKLGRGLLAKFLGKHVVICNQCSESLLMWIIFLSRLFPFFQFDIISYGAGLTTISLKRFAVATFFGMIPVTFLVAFFGKSLVVGKFLSVFISVLLIVAFFGVPMLIEKYNLFGLRDKILVKDVK